ncbi:hypothetical protein LSAT2_009469, partial [Lamellibrachia satsuma]
MYCSGDRLGFNSIGDVGALQITEVAVTLAGLEILWLHHIRVTSDVINRVKLRFHMYGCGMRCATTNGYSVN